MCFLFFPNDEITIYSRSLSLRAKAQFDNNRHQVRRNVFYIISDLLRENFTKHALAKRAKEILPCHKTIFSFCYPKLKKVRKKFSSRDFGLLNLGRLWKSF